MLKVGLTGGIGSGKSSVSALLAARGATVIDADVIAREVVAPGTPGLAAVVAQFGREMLREDGSLDRERLGSLVFKDPERLAQLNAIVHPLVGQQTQRRLSRAEADGAEIVVFDVPLLVENGLQALYDVVVVVATEPATQLSRLLGARGMSESDARARIAAQAPLAAKLAVATYVVRNDGSHVDLHHQVDALWTALSSRVTNL